MSPLVGVAGLPRVGVVGTTADVPLPDALLVLAEALFTCGGRNLNKINRHVILRSDNM